MTVAALPAGDAAERRVLAARIAAVRARIEAACARAGRDPGAVTLVGVSKTHSAATIAAAHAAGLRDFGENRVQEAGPKIESLRAAGVSPVWHLVGHLQTNKVRAALGLFAILHGVDSERLAAAISRAAPRPVRVFLQVNVAEEASKHGADPAAAPALAERIARLPNVDLAGLMTVAPRADNPEDVRPVFQRLRMLRDALGLRDLSMGMTDDFEVAVEERATLVRVGRAIFGERPAAGAEEEP
ncbi:MAG: YggS family pyridoxal phosphate-dependent enzyme [Chloroflexota bacterium]|nr:YggS family pyridoxal phosphate-dependent enzyme [Chloroflexota bacterium]